MDEQIDGPRKRWLQYVEDDLMRLGVTNWRQVVDYRNDVDQSFWKPELIVNLNAESKLMTNLNSDCDYNSNHLQTCLLMV